MHTPYQGEDAMSKWIIDNAGSIFQLGLTHGYAGTKTWNAHDVMYVCMNAPKDLDWRKFHTRKVRQIYGAGFDVARMNLMIRKG